MASIRKIKIQARRQGIRNEAKARAKDKKDAIDTANRVSSECRKDVRNFLGFDKIKIKSKRTYNDNNW